MQTYSMNKASIAAGIWFNLTIVFTSSIFFSPFSAAEQTQRKPIFDPLESLSRFMPTQCLFTGRFTQIKMNPNFTLASDGTLFYNCNYGLVWQSLNPFLETTVYKQNGQNFLLSEEDDIEELTSQSQKGLANFLLRLMSGDTNYFLDSFSIEAIENNIKLIPNSKLMKRAVDDIILSSDGTPGSIDKFSIETTINATNGDSTKVTIANLIALPSKDKADQDLACKQAFSHQDIICSILKRKKNNVYKR